MKQTLRPFQAKAIDECRQQIGAHPILVSPTGSGKTTIAAHIVDSAVSRGKRVLFLAHRKELIEQACERFSGYVHCGIIKAGVTPTPDAPVQIASVQTLINRKPPPADLIIVDECHHSNSATYQEILGWYPSAFRLGLTATPFRTDGTGLGDAGFGALVVAATAKELIREGFLMEPRVFVGKELPDLKGIRKRAGDYILGQLSMACDKPKLIADIVENWHRHGANRLTIIFASSVEHSKHIAEQFGDIAAHLDGTTDIDERTDILDRFKRGEIRIITNYGVLTEGWDVPSAAVCILARPTQSLGLYMQMAGRVLRPFPGKDAPVILDHGGNTERHGWVTQDLQYSLESVKRKSASTGVRNCPKCFALMPSSVSVCPECGYQFIPEPREGSQQVAGVMEEMTPDALERRTYARFVSQASERGNRIGWARHKFHDKYGRWPLYKTIEKHFYRPLGTEIIPEAGEPWLKAADVAAEKKRARVWVSPTFSERSFDTSQLAATFAHGDKTPESHDVETP